MEAEPVVVRNVFPAEVVLPDGSLKTQALVKVTRERVYVWHGERDLIVDEAHGLDADGLAELPPSYAMRANALRIPLDGGTLTVNKGKGCGCSSPLKSFRPFGVERQSFA